MVYLAGDNNLSSAGEIDLAEMRRVGSSDEVNIVTEFDNAGAAGTVRYHIEKDGLNEEKMKVPETDSGDPKVLIDFVLWAVDKYPADRYGLILWNHGNGWQPTEIDDVADKVNAKNYNKRESVERTTSPLAKTLFRPTLEKIFSLPGPLERAICEDDGSGHSLDTVELGKVLQKVTNEVGARINLLGMDACLMSNLEVAYEVAPYVDYIVASEESEPNNGWPYDRILARLVANPDMETSEFAAAIVDDYVQSYRDTGHPGPITQSALFAERPDPEQPGAEDTGLNSLVIELNLLAKLLQDSLPDSADDIWKAQRKSARFYHNTLWDISHFCNTLEEITEDQAIKEAAQRVQASLQVAGEGFLISEDHFGDSVAECGGMTIYMPALTNVNQFYSKLAFAEQGWIHLLNAYAGA